MADSRWYTGSGIYRKVTLVIKDRISIDNYGLFVSTREINERGAELEVQTSISNTTDEDAEIEVNYYVVDHNGDLAA